MNELGAPIPEPYFLLGQTLPDGIALEVNFQVESLAVFPTIRD